MTGSASNPLRQDTPGFQWLLYGSAHTLGFSVVLCDGSTRTLSYDIERAGYNYLTNRGDGQVIKPTDF